MNDKVLKTLEFDKICESVESYASCELGKKYARELQPLSDPDEINRLLTETEDGVNCILKRGSAPSAGVRNLSGVIIRAQTESVLNNTDLLGIKSLLTAVRRMISYASVQDSEPESLTSVENMFYRLVNLTTLENEITRCILSEDEIADDASPALSDIRRKIFQIQGSIKDKLNELTHSSRYAKALQDNIVTMRGDRYCIPVKIENRGEIPGIVHDTSSSGQTLFIEPAFVVESNNKIRELRVSEQEEIERILKELSEMVADESAVLSSDLNLVSYIDFTLAKAAWALANNASRPLLNTDGVIDLKKARHPLLDKKKAVPVTITLGTSDPGMVPATSMIITGPNTGGKTVTLKTTGLLHLMAQSGMMIPCAENSRICVFNDIFADIGDEQSIAQSLSTFSAHMKNITEILKKADYRSLTLFDELGAGTDPVEGAALAMAILERVYEIGAVCLSSTHYSELKVFASTTPGFVNASCEFDVDTLAPTYRLLIGVPGKSNAFAISEKLGLDPSIVSRAKEFVSAEDLRFEDMLKGIEQNRMKAEAEAEETERLKKEAEELYEEAKLRKEELVRESMELRYKASVRAREADNKARAAAEKMLTEIRRAALLGGNEAVKAAEAAKREFEKIAGELEADIGKAETVPSVLIDADFDVNNLKQGDKVKILSLGREAVVLAPPKPDGRVYVQAGSIKLYAEKDDVAPAAPASKAGKNASNKADKNLKPDKQRDRIYSTASSVKPEIDVRGMTVEEATEIIERQINEATMAGLESFRIVHGKGTGALRRGVQSYLRSLKTVASFRDGSFGEGDLGVTVVKLKN
ncbi:MAG: endonuclease MutS2 [Clostridia bacterium]|nr:endonuclease MutS2 [Clostridia bacterium]